LCDIGGGKVRVVDKVKRLAAAVVVVVAVVVVFKSNRNV
jgi:hypothetical protein